MRVPLISLIIIYTLVSGVFAQKTIREGLLISFDIKTKVEVDTFPYLIANKDWNAGKIISLESNSNFRETLTSGTRLGWALFLQPNGALGWNIGNEKRRLDYLPTAKRKINDGKWHTIEVFYDLEGRSMWLWLDKVHLTTYNLRGMNMDVSMLANQINKNPTFKIRKLRMGDQHKSKEQVFRDQEHLRIANWNIWHGGRHNGREEGVRQVIGHLRTQKPDIICMQETYGSGPIIADSLGFTFYSISSNLSIMTHFPIQELYQGYDDFRFGGVKLGIGQGKEVAVFDIWINSSPSSNQHLKDQVPLGVMLGEEMKTRGREILQIHKAIKELGIHPDLPRIMAGDFNSGSHLDWTQRTAERHKGFVVPWPVSRTMYREGYVDVWRTMNPDEVLQTGYTWSPRFKNTLQYRIDYIYTDALYWNYVTSEIVGYELGKEWPSDHAMVTATINLKKMDNQP